MNHDASLVDVMLISDDSASQAPAAPATSEGKARDAAMAAHGTRAPPGTADASQHAKQHVETIHTTTNHPWYTADHGWLPAGLLRVGERVVRADGTTASTATVVAVRAVAGAAAMWDLAVGQVHTFAVGDGRYVVHNCGQTFENTMPEKLDQELADAKRLGVEPMTVDDPRFEELANADRMKWAVTEDGQLLVEPKFVNGEEIPHTVLTGGAPVLAAGEANIAFSGGQRIGVDITNHSGHYLPSLESLQIGIDAFASYGILF